MITILLNSDTLREIDITKTNKLIERRIAHELLKISTALHRSRLIQGEILYRRHPHCAVSPFMAESLDTHPADW